MTDNDMRRILGAKSKIQLRNVSKMSDEDDNELRRRYYKLGESKESLMAHYQISDSTFVRKTFSGKNFSDPQ